MRAATLILVGLLAIALAPTIGAHTSTWVATYVANPAEIPRVAGPYASIQGFAPSAGGAVFPVHNHSGTVDIWVQDRLYGPIDAWVCQNLDGDVFCDAVDGDATACIVDGQLLGWPVVASKPVVVFVSAVGFSVEGCDPPNHIGYATAGTITAKFS